MVSSYWLVFGRYNRYCILSLYLQKEKVKYRLRIIDKKAAEITIYLKDDNKNLIPLRISKFVFENFKALQSRNTV